MQNSVKDFLDGYLCSEAIVKNFTDDKSLLKASTAFGAGIAYGNSLCGAITGGILVLSQNQGRTSKEESFDKTFENIGILNQSFKEEFGACECPALLGFKLTDSDGGQRFESEDCKNQKCAKYIDFVVNKTQELLNKDNTSS